MAKTATSSRAQASIDAEVAQLATRLRVEIGRLKRQVRQHTHEDLTPSQVSALATLDKHGALRLGELARIEVISPPTLTNIVGGLEQRGLVERSSDPSDRRSARVDLTRAGRSALARIRNERTAFLAQRIAALSTSERRRLADAIDLLTRLAEPS